MLCYKKLSWDNIPPIMPPEVFHVAGALGNHAAYRGKKEVSFIESHFVLARASRCRGNKIICTNLGYAVQATGNACETDISPKHTAEP